MAPSEPPGSTHVPPTVHLGSSCEPPPSMMRTAKEAQRDASPTQHRAERYHPPPPRPKLPTKESITQRAAWPTRFGPRHHDVAVPGGLDKARRETVMVGIRNRVRLTIEAAQNSPVWPVLPGSRHGEDRRWARCALATLFQRRFLDMLACTDNCTTCRVLQICTGTTSIISSIRFAHGKQRLLPR